MGKHAGQIAAAGALEKLYPEVHAACFEAHATARGTMFMDTGPGEGGAVRTMTGNCDPKGLLNGRLSMIVGRQLNPGDVNYDTHRWPALHALLSGFSTQRAGSPCVSVNRFRLFNY